MNKEERKYYIHDFVGGILYAARIQGITYLPCDNAVHKAFERVFEKFHKRIAPVAHLKPMFRIRTHFLHGDSLMVYEELGNQPSWVLRIDRTYNVYRFEMSVNEAEHYLKECLSVPLPRKFYMRLAKRFLRYLSEEQKTAR